MRLRRLVAAVACFLAVSSISCAALASPSVEECLEQARQSFVGKAVRTTFRPSSLARHDDVLADARGVVWRPRARLRGPGAGRYAAAFDGANSCWIGGEIVGTGRSARTAPSGIAVGTVHATSNTEIHSLQISRTLNAVRVGPEAVELRLTNLLLTEVRDTCLIADHRGDLIVDEVFFDRCARVMKVPSRPPGSTLTIRNSLIRIHNGKSARARGRLFNRDALRAGTRVAFHDNVVVTAKRLDRHSLAAIAASCESNTLIWLGRGDYPGDLPDCFEVIEGRSAWRAARRAWMRQHRRELVELGGGGPGAGGPACALPGLPARVGPRKTVGNGTPESCTEEALRAALAGGGTIAFSCGPAPVTIPIGSELVVASRTVLDGGGRITLDGRNRTRIIRNQSQLTLERMTLRRGRAAVVWRGTPDGGGAVNTTYGNRLYVVDSTFTGNRTSTQGFGGAIFQAGGGALTVIRSRFEDNAGGGGGAIYNLLAGLQVANSTFLRNQGTSGRQGGGAIMTDGASADSGDGGSGGEIVLCGSSFSSNTALATGGGAYLYAYARDRVRVSRSSFTANAVTPNSGGLSMGGGLRFGASPALVSDSEFRNNTARTGGAIATNGQAQTQVRDSTFECNSSDIAGGRVLAEGNTSRGC
jgi:hypothetical protein